MILSSKQKILIAAYKLNKKSFSSEELSVKTWELYKQDFGLEGFTDKYPNTNAIYINWNRILPIKSKINCNLFFEINVLKRN